MARRLSAAATSGDGKEPTNPIYSDKQKAEALERAVEAYRAERKAKDAHAKANGKYRAELKETAKIRGEEVASIVRALKARDADPAEIQREEAEYHTLLRDMGMTDLFAYADWLEKAGGTTAKSAHETAAELAAAKEAGQAAGKAGISRTENPHPAASKLQDAWAAGWMAGQRQNAPDAKEPSGASPIGHNSRKRSGSGKSSRPKAA